MNYVATHANISVCGKYRWLLSREWRDPDNRDPRHWRTLGKDGAGNDWEEPKSVLFVLLNPSTADADKDDPTIRRCVGFARRLKYERLEVVNLFAWRATNPRDILQMSFAGGPDPVGSENQRFVEMTSLEAGIIICAWGANGDYLGQAETARGWMAARPHYCLGFTKGRQPRHPLYLPADATIERMPL